MNQDALLQKLPRETAEAVQKVLGIVAERGPTLERRDYGDMKSALVMQNKELRAALDFAFASVHFPRINAPMPLASMLTQEQRALATILAHVIVTTGDWAIPQQSWCRRRWLGIDPPGVLEREHQAILAGQSVTWPLWYLLRDMTDPAKTRDDEQAESFWESLPIEERLEAYGEIALKAYDLEAQDFASPEGDIQGDEGREWAPAYAERVVSLFSDDRLYDERGQEAQIPPQIKSLVCTALLQAQVPIEPRWARLIPIVTNPPERLKRSKELLRAIPTEQQGAVILASLQEMFASQAMRTALALIDEFPLGELAQYIIDNSADIDGQPRRTILGRLQEISQRHPHLDALVAPVIAALPALPALRWGSFIRAPKPEEISELQRQQCHAGSSGMMGAGESWCNNGESEYLELGAIVDEEGTPYFDAAIYLEEDGTFFRTGTTEPVAWLCQYRLDCPEPLLKEVLQLLLANKPSEEEADDEDLIDDEDDE